MNMHHLSYEAARHEHLADIRRAELMARLMRDSDLGTRRRRPSRRALRRAGSEQ